MICAMQAKKQAGKEGDKAAKAEEDLAKQKEKASKAKDKDAPASVEESDAMSKAKEKKQGKIKKGAPPPPAPPPAATAGASPPGNFFHGSLGFHVQLSCFCVCRCGRSAFRCSVRHIQSVRTSFADRRCSYRPDEEPASAPLSGFG